MRSSVRQFTLYRVTAGGFARRHRLAGLDKTFSLYFAIQGFVPLCNSYKYTYFPNAATVQTKSNLGLGKSVVLHSIQLNSIRFVLKAVNVLYCKRCGMFEIYTSYFPILIITNEQYVEERMGTPTGQNLLSPVSVYIFPRVRPTTWRLGRQLELLDYSVKARAFYAVVGVYIYVVNVEVVCGSRRSCPCTVLRPLVVCALPTYTPYILLGFTWITSTVAGFTLM